MQASAFWLFPPTFNGEDCPDTDRPQLNVQSDPQISYVSGAEARKHVANARVLKEANCCATLKGWFLEAPWRLCGR